MSPRAALTSPAITVQGTWVGVSACNCARCLPQTPRPMRRTGAVQRYHTRCVPVAHMSSQVFYQVRGRAGALWLTHAWTPAFAPSTQRQRHADPHASIQERDECWRDCTRQ